MYLHFAFNLFSVVVHALRDVQVTVPAAVKKGDNVKLICLYDMEGDSLYSVKWYKGRREFYRYTPKENPAMKTFLIPGINVVVSILKIMYYFIVCWNIISKTIKWDEMLMLTHFTNVCTIIAYIKSSLPRKFRLDCTNNTNWYIGRYMGAVVLIV